MIRTLHRTWMRLVGSLSRQRRESDLAEEFETRLIAEENIRRGFPPDEAHHRNQRRLPRLDALRKDLRYALRGIRRWASRRTA